MTDFYTFRLLKAREQYQCEACRSPIPPGTIYAQVSGAFEKGFWHAKFHADCHAAWGDFVEALGCDHSELGDYLADELEVMSPSVARNALNVVRSTYPDVVARLEATLHKRNDHK